jgi:hypothetical protein
MEIDLALALHSASKRALGERYGLVHTSIWRHEARHLAPEMIAQARASLEAQVVTAREISIEAVTNARKVANECLSGGRRDQYLRSLETLLKANDQWARINKEISSDSVTAVLFEIGVRSVAEARSRLEVTEGMEKIPIEIVQEKAIETLQKVWRRKPELRQDAMHALQGLSYALEITNGESNGHSE